MSEVEATIETRENPHARRVAHLNPPLKRPRNFIPEGAPLTKPEQDRLLDDEAGVPTVPGGLPKGRGRNFVPPPGFVVEKGPGDAEANKAAEVAAAARQAEAKQREWSSAVKKLTNMTPSAAVEFIQTMPVAYQELYILAEGETLAREAVLMYFPKVGPIGYKRWELFLSPEKAEEDADAEAPEAEAEEASEAVLEVADEAPQAEAEADVAPEAAEPEAQTEE